MDKNPANLLRNSNGRAGSFEPAPETSAGVVSLDDRQQVAGVVLVLAGIAANALKDGNAPIHFLHDEVSNILVPGREYKNLNRRLGTDDDIVHKRSRCNHQKSYMP